MKRTGLAWILSAGIGAIVWLAVRILGGADPLRAGSLYLWFGWPLLVLAAFFLGWSFPRRAWRWPVAMIGTEAVLRLAALGGVADPRELVLLALVAIPCVFAGWLGGAVGESGAGAGPTCGTEGTPD